VKIRYADMNTHLRQQRIPYTACDHLLMPMMHELFNKLYDRRQRIRLVGVRFSHLVGGGHQMNAFTTNLASLFMKLVVSIGPSSRRISARYRSSSSIRCLSSALSIAAPDTP
jgi:hypothetical protein